MCEWKPDFDGLNERVTKIEGRMTQVEHDVGKMRAETQDGFKAGAAQNNPLQGRIAELLERATSAEARAARLDRLRDWLVEQRDKSPLQTVKAIYQAIINKIDEKLEAQ